MCQCSESEGRPCGLADRFRVAVEAFRGAGRAESDDPIGDELMAAITHARHLARCRRDGRPVCDDCEELLQHGEQGPLHGRLCGTCSQTWLEDNILTPLVHRLGRRGARRALLRLVKNVKALI